MIPDELAAATATDIDGETQKIPFEVEAHFPEPLLKTDIPSTTKVTTQEEVQ
jgi:hypothetical protein